MQRVVLCHIGALIAGAVSTAEAATTARNILDPSVLRGDSPYGYIVNTDGGTFDGVALAEAVQISTEMALLNGPITGVAAPAGSGLSTK